MSPAAPGGVVVLYHPSADILSNVASYRKFLSRFYVIDNSETPSDVARQLEKTPGARLLSAGNNLGLARALNLAAAEAIRDGFGWLLTMDQDSFFAPGVFEDYLKHSEKFFASKEVAVIAPEVLWNESVRVDGAPRFEDAEVVWTSGALLNLSCFDEIGGFDERFFIDEIDHDYCLRAKLAGRRVLRLEGVPMEHRLGQTRTVRRGGREKKYASHNAVRMYYITRNNLHMWAKYRRSYPGFVRRRMHSLLSRTRDVLFYEKDLKKFAYMLRGGVDFLRGRYGKL